MAGGIATMVSDLCECLAEMGYKVSVIIPYYHLNNKGLAGYIKDSERVGDIHI